MIKYIADMGEFSCSCGNSNIHLNLNVWQRPTMKVDVSLSIDDIKFVSNHEQLAEYILHEYLILHERCTQTQKAVLAFSKELWGTIAVAKGCR